MVISIVRNPFKPSPHTDVLHFQHKIGQTPGRNAFLVLNSILYRYYHHKKIRLPKIICGRTDRKKSHKISTVKKKKCTTMALVCE